MTSRVRAIHAADLTQSEQRCWLSCRRRWLWNYGCRLGTRSKNVNLWLGSLVHELLAGWYGTWLRAGVQPPPGVLDGVLRGRSVLSPDFVAWLQEHGGILQDADLAWRAEGLLAAAEREARECMAGAQQDRDAGIEGTVAAFTQVDLADHLRLAEDMLRRYVVQVSAQDRWRIVSVEAELAMPLMAKVRTAQRKTYRGKVDLLVRGEDGRLRIVEHKTSGSKDLPGEMVRYRVDVQARSYLRLAEHAIGERPVEVVYNLLRKASPCEPVLVTCTAAHKGLAVPCPKCGTLDGKVLGEKAKAVSTAKGTDTTPERYEAAVRGVGGDPWFAEYQDVVRRCGQIRWFYREAVLVGEEDAAEAQAEAYRVACEVGQALTLLGRHDERGPLPRSVRAWFPRATNSCWDYGRRCIYAPLCEEDSAVRRAGYVVRDGRHAELGE